MICTQPSSSSLSKMDSSHASNDDNACLRREESFVRSRRAACPAGRRPEYLSSLNLFSWAGANINIAENSRNITTNSHATTTRSSDKAMSTSCPRRVFARHNNYITTSAAMHNRAVAAPAASATATPVNAAVSQDTIGANVPPLILTPTAMNTRINANSTMEDKVNAQANTSGIDGNVCIHTHAPDAAGMIKAITTTAASGSRRDASRSRLSSNPSWWHDENTPNEPSLLSSRHGVHRANMESSATCEFASSGIRRVTPPRHVDLVYGIRQVPHARGAQQQLQVVNVSAGYHNLNTIHSNSYNDKTSNSSNSGADTSSTKGSNANVNEVNILRRRPSLRLQPNKRDSSEVYDVLRYAGTTEQLHCSLIRQPVGRCNSFLSARARRGATGDLTARERFAQCVRDHVQQRARGVAEFYVHLTRDRVGEVTPRTPRPQLPVTGKLEEPSARPVLTLSRCLDQLISLTRIPVTMDDLAVLVWGPRYRHTVTGEHETSTRVSNDSDCNNGKNYTSCAVAPRPDRARSESPSIIAVSSLDGSEMECGEDGTEWGNRPVLFRHFAAAFSAHTEDSRLAIVRV